MTNIQVTDLLETSLISLSAQETASVQGGTTAFIFNDGVIYTNLNERPNTAIDLRGTPFTMNNMPPGTGLHGPAGQIIGGISTYTFITPTHTVIPLYEVQH